MKLRFRFFALIGLLQVITACGPIYSTEYKFVPPKSSGGKSCLDRCPDMKDQCLEIEELNKDECEEINRRHMEDCEDEISRKEHRAPKWNECGKIKGCGVSTERCEEAYRSCYRACGGEVIEEQVCVANCDQIKPK